MKRILSVFFSLFLLFPNFVCAKEYYVFSEGKSNYVIVVSSQASESEKYAASELQSCFEKIGGVKLPIVDCGTGNKGNRIIIGYNSDSKKLFCAERKREANDESFTYRSKKGEIVIIGGSERGTMYGVFAFLENELGCHWLAEDCTIMPSLKDYSFTSLNRSEAPTFARRSILYRGCKSTVFRAHNRLNERIQTSPGNYQKQIGGSYIFLSPHTIGFLMPVEQYYEKYPEFYALIDGNRAKDKTQPCFSNADIFDICVNGLRELMRKHTDYSVYELSTLDNNNRCECQQCQEAIERLGNYTDLVLDFVNRAADALKDEFPTKKIEFLAHGKTREPPLNVKPRDNVVVRLCNGASCHIHGLESCSYENSKLFLIYLKRWREITNELYIWEYASNFYWYHIPFPNFYALQDNLVTFHNFGTAGVFIEGNHYSDVSEFRALRIYVLTKLLWNPHCDLNKVVDVFMEGYYETAAKYMRQYFDFLHSQVKEDDHMKYTASYIEPYYSERLMTTARAILDKAKGATDDEVILHRIEMEELTVDFLKTMKDPKESKKDGTLERVKRVIEREGLPKIGSSGAEKIYQKIVAPQL